MIEDRCIWMRVVLWAIVSLCPFLLLLTDNPLTALCFSWVVSAAFAFAIIFEGMTINKLNEHIAYLRRTK